jgi:hypothetical protein
VIYMSIDGDGQGEIPWRKSRFSVGNGACVEVAAIAHGILVRDSTDPDGPVLGCSGRAWRVLTEAVRAGALDRQTFVR